jgi:hypothetical protein
MKNTSPYLIALALLSNLLLIACQQEAHPIDHIDDSGISFLDTVHTREPPQKRLSVKDAFLKLSKNELFLDGIKNMSVQERKIVLKSEKTDNYEMIWAGNYLKITEKASNKDDGFEQIEQIRLAVFNSLQQKNIVFISQELIDESRQTVKIIQQDFYQYQRNTWENINQQMPPITTKTFLDNNSKVFSINDYFCFKPNPLDINYLQAILMHEKYPNKDVIAENEAYKVALVWTGNEFILDRQAIVQYNISEHHAH